MTEAAAINSALTGLVIAVSGILLMVARDHLVSAADWLRHGFAAAPGAGRKAASVFVFGGVLPFGFLQTLIRSVDHPISDLTRYAIAFPGWMLIGYGAVMWQAVVVAEAVDARGGNGRRAGRAVFSSYSIFIAGSIALSVLWHPFHAPVLPCPAPQAGCGRTQ